MRQYLNYGDFIYDHPNNSAISDKIESIQNNEALVITGAVKRTSNQ